MLALDSSQTKALIGYEERRWQVLKLKLHKVL
jgi:hypothetical protein